MFTERPNPVHMVRLPSIHFGFALTGHQWPPGSCPDRCRDSCVTSGDGALNVVSSGLPSSSAASMVNSLNVDPDWYPVTLPPPAISWSTVFG